MVSVPRMVHELPLDDRFTQYRGRLFIAFLLLRNKPELLPSLPPLTESLVHATRARSSRATRCTLQNPHKRDVVGHAHTRPRPRENQCGQALIEFTLFFTFMMFMVAGVIDIAGLLDSHVNLVYAARQGTRTGAVLGNRANADCAIVGAIHATLLNQPNVTLTTITIFQVTYGGTVTGNKEVYSGGAVCDSTGNFPAGQPSVNTWPASQRTVTAFDEDTIGVRLDFTYAWRFNVVGFSSFSGYDVAEYPLNPNGVPTAVPPGAPTPTPCPPIIVCV